MEKFDINNLDVKYKENDFNYQITINKDSYGYRFYVTRIKFFDNFSIYDALSLHTFDNISKVYRNKVDKSLNNIKLSTKEKIEIINETFESLENCNLLSGFIEFGKIKNKFISDHINILIANNDIGLSCKNINCIKNDNVKIDIVRLDSNEIIGEIIKENNMISLNVVDCYKEDVFNLYENLNLISSTKKLCKKNNSKI